MWSLSRVARVLREPLRTAFRLRHSFLFSPGSLDSYDSILIGQQKRGVRAVRFGNDPQAVTGGGAVAAEEPETFLQAELVFLLIFLGDFAPIARDMARKELHGILSGFFKNGQRAR